MKIFHEANLILLGQKTEIHFFAKVETLLSASIRASKLKVTISYSIKSNLLNMFELNPFKSPMAFSGLGGLKIEDAFERRYVGSYFSSTSTPTKGKHSQKPSSFNGFLLY